MVGLIRVNSKLLNILILIFLTHGCLYFLFPQDIYNIASPIRYIKYIIIILILLLVLNDAKLYKIILYILVVISLSSINIIAVGKNFNLILLINYLMPLSVLFFLEGLSKYLKKNMIAVTVYVIMTVFAYIEFFILYGIFPIFADSGYRVVSIFVNPNNLGLVTVILTSYILGNKLIKNNLVFMLVILNSVFILILSGSRSSMIIFSMVMILYFLKKVAEIFRNMKINLNKLLLTNIVTIFILLLLAIFNEAINNFFNQLIFNKIRALGTIDFAAGRMNQYLFFLENANYNLIFPLSNNLSYTDNLYLTIWGSFGLPILIFFVFINTILLIKILFEKRELEFFLLLIFLIAGLAENFIYLWPIAYIYWYLVANILDKKKSSKLLMNKG